MKVSYNRCKDIHKFGNKYLPLAYKTQVDFRSHFSGKKSASYSPRNTVNKTHSSKLHNGCHYSLLVSTVYLYKGSELTSNGFSFLVNGY